MASRHMRVKRGMAGVAVVRVGIGSFPIVIAEMELREGNEHPGIVGRAQYFLEGKVRPRIAVVVVRINKIDAETLQAAEGLLRGVIRRACDAKRGVGDRHRGKMDAGPVEIK